MSCCVVLPYLVLCASCCAILCYNVLCLREMLISCLSHAYGAFLNSTAMCQRIRILPSCVFIVLVRLGVLLMFMVPYHQKGHFKGNRDVSLCLPTQTIFLQINVSYLLQIRFQGNLFLEHPTTALATCSSFLVVGKHGSTRVRRRLGAGQWVCMQQRIKFLLKLGPWKTWNRAAS